MLESVDGAHTKSRHGVWTKMLPVQSGIEATRTGLQEAGSGHGVEVQGIRYGLASAGSAMHKQQ
jgi:hypothetical protein